MGGFGWEEQVELRDTCLNLFERGHSVVISNAYCSETVELYKDFKINTVTAPRSISRNADGRQAVKELLCVLSHEKR